ncbi:hypothetical protein [Motilimonas pumila]|uniref:Uncharacterized protein n=1 Tax=Motilimonas pumila TaxID=2303987 RepID=A0A418YDZ9_9GAMM|nr:hypothetical protein [Motilimonas pumila]RJG42776.1 hypothetical protein D1Z90_11850 [Motilimonas pumila]
MPIGSNPSPVQGNSPLSPTSTVSVSVNTDETNSVSNSQVMGGRDVSEANNTEATKTFREKFSECCNKVKDFFAPLGQKQTWIDLGQSIKSGAHSIGHAISDGTQRGWDNAIDGLKGITPGFESQKQRNERIEGEVQQVLSTMDTMMETFGIDDLSDLEGSIEMFYNHTKKEFSPENVLCFQAAGQDIYPNGRDSDSPEDRLAAMTDDPQKLVDFYNDFVASGAEFQLNISFSANQKFTAALEAFVATPTTPDTVNGQTQQELEQLTSQRKQDVSDTLEVCLKEIHYLLGDTRTRFNQLDH